MPRHDYDTASFSVVSGGYVVTGFPDGLPATYAEMKKHAALVDEYNIDQDGLCSVAVSKAGGAWPFLLVAQSTSPLGTGFEPSALLLPEKDILFVGAGERLLAYSLSPAKRLWEDAADTGFWHWALHGDIVLMAAELEAAAWDTDANKLWSTFVEPPWDYEVSLEAGEITLDVMGKKRSFSLHAGPEQES